jgi:predicted phosphodiesterase
VKIIHTGDIHIGSAFAGLSPEKAAIRKRELMQNFRSVCDFAYREQVAAVLLVGDLFDENVVPSFVQKEVFALIENAAPVCFFYVSGNHDYGNDLSILKAQGVLPNNLRLFESENGWKSYDLGDEICITGADTRVFSRAFDNVPHLPREKFNIMLLHGQTVSGERRNAEDIPLAYLRDKNVDYLAGNMMSIRSVVGDVMNNRATYNYYTKKNNNRYEVKYPYAVIPFTSITLEDLHYEPTNPVHKLFFKSDRFWYPVQPNGYDGRVFYRSLPAVDALTNKYSGSLHMKNLEGVNNTQANEYVYSYCSGGSGSWTHNNMLYIHSGPCFMPPSTRDEKIKYE